MTEAERSILIDALKRDVPYYYERIKQRTQLKKEMISKCIRIASSYDNNDYKTEIKRLLYSRSRARLSETELILLNYICLIRHKEYININTQLKNDEEIQKWVEVLKRYIVEDESVFSLLKKHSLQIIEKYRFKKSVGRPKGTGKQVFIYNGKEYRTIQECADDYGISKQGMYKRLRKLNII